ncbi:MAG: hypothetical protein ACXVAW_18550 [Vulcanimicrobiaceae bacterium]
MTRIETMTRHLYNALLQQRQDAYRLRRISVTAKMQYAEMTALRKESFQLAFFGASSTAMHPAFHASVQLAAGVKLSSRTGIAHSNSMLRSDA